MQCVSNTGKDWSVSPSSEFCASGLLKILWGCTYNVFLWVVYLMFHSFWGGHVCKWIKTKWYKDTFWKRNFLIQYSHTVKYLRDWCIVQWAAELLNITAFDGLTPHVLYVTQENIVFMLLLLNSCFSKKLHLYWCFSVWLDWRLSNVGSYTRPPNHRC